MGSSTNVHCFYQFAEYIYQRLFKPSRREVKRIPCFYKVLIRPLKNYEKTCAFKILFERVACVSLITDIFIASRIKLNRNNIGITRTTSNQDVKFSTWAKYGLTSKSNKFSRTKVKKALPNNNVSLTLYFCYQCPMLDDKKWKYLLICHSSSPLQ